MSQKQSTQEHRNHLPGSLELKAGDFPALPDSLSAHDNKVEPKKLLKEDPVKTKESQTIEAFVTKLKPGTQAHTLHTLLGADDLLEVRCFLNAKNQTFALVTFSSPEALRDAALKQKKHGLHIFSKTSENQNDWQVK